MQLKNLTFITEYLQIKESLNYININDDSHFNLQLPQTDQLPISDFIYKGEINDLSIDKIKKIFNKLYKKYIIANDAMYEINISHSLRLKISALVEENENMKKYFLNKYKRDSGCKDDQYYDVVINEKWDNQLYDTVKILVQYFDEAVEQLKKTTS